MENRSVPTDAKVWPREQLRTSVAFVIAATMLTACLPYTYGLPAVIGRVTTSDTTSARMMFAVSGGGDADACKHATARGTTNTSGVFDLPSSSADTWVVVIPPLERFSNPYWICAGPSDSTLRAVYQGTTPLSTKVVADTLGCFQWLWQGEERVTCARRSEQQRSVVTGGAWREGDTSGSYRLILPFQRDVPRILVQWLESSHVQAIAALPLTPKTQRIDDVRLEERYAGSWCVTILSQPHPQSFELGPPGKVATAALPYCAHDAR